MEAERCLPFTQATRRGVEILCIDIKLLTILPRAESYPPPPPSPRNVPKCAIIVVFDFSWGDCIKRRKKLETMVIKNWVGGGGRGEGGK